ncbi:MAG TPA: type II toxin-antitoxin system PemK/MazF family toxin [Chloroflexota bacterium]
MASSGPVPRRGEVWIVNFDPTVGSEIRKTRPAVVVSSDGVGRLPVKLVVPLTDWKPHYAGNIWHVHLSPSKSNGLAKDSAADALQVRCVSVRRFQHHIGRLSAAQMEEIAAAIAAVVEFQ